MQAGRSVGAKCDIAIDDAVTHADVLDVFANGFDYPGGLVADDRWKGRDRKSTSTIINVDEVETYDGVADQCFIVARLTHDDVLEPQHGSRAACEIAGMNLEEIGELQHAAGKSRGWQPVVRCGHCEWRHLGVRYAGTE